MALFIFKVTIERDLSISRLLSSHPIVWTLLTLLARLHPHFTIEIICSQGTACSLLLLCAGEGSGCSKHFPLAKPHHQQAHRPPCPVGQHQACAGVDGHRPILTAPIGPCPSGQDSSPRSNNLVSINIHHHQYPSPGDRHF